MEQRVYVPGITERFASFSNVASIFAYFGIL